MISVCWWFDLQLVPFNRTATIILRQRPCKDDGRVAFITINTCRRSRWLRGYSCTCLNSNLEWISLKGTLDWTFVVVGLNDKVMGSYGEPWCIYRNNRLGTIANYCHTTKRACLPEVDFEDICNWFGRVCIDMRYGDRTCLALLNNQTGRQLRISCVDRSKHGKRTEGLSEGAC